MSTEFDRIVDQLHTAEYNRMPPLGMMLDTLLIHHGLQSNPARGTLPIKRVTDG